MNATVDEDLFQVGAAVCEREEAVVGESVQSGEHDPPQRAAPGDLRHTHIRHLRHTKQFKLNVKKLNVTRIRTIQYQLYNCVRSGES